MSESFFVPADKKSILFECEGPKSCLAETQDICENMIDNYQDMGYEFVCPNAVNTSTLIKKAIVKTANNGADHN